MGKDAGGHERVQPTLHTLHSNVTTVMKHADLNRDGQYPYDYIGEQPDWRLQFMEADESTCIAVD